MIRASGDDLFMTNFEITTGNCYNCTWSKSQMPFYGKFLIYNLNALVFSRNFIGKKESDEFEWAAGYGFMRIYYNKSSNSAGDTNNRRYFFSYGLKFIQLNKEKKFDSTLSLLTRLHGEAGIRIPKIGLYAFGGVTFNYYQHRDTPLIRKELASGSYGNTDFQLWPSYSFGIQL